MKTKNGTILQQYFSDDNFAVIRDKDIDGIMFGCPPGIVKYFNKKNEPIPANIVIPQRTFRKGKNCLDLEFVAYSIIFFSKRKKPINIICTKIQEGRIRIVLHEALFGPDLKEIFRSILFSSLMKFCFNKRKIKSLETLAERIGTSREIFLLLKESIVRDRTQRKVLSKMQPVLRKYFGKILWIRELEHERIGYYITKAYLNAAMLKCEMNFFAACSEGKNDEFVNKYVQFHHYNSKDKVTLNGSNSSVFQICQTKTGDFKVMKNGKSVSSFILGRTDEDKESVQVASSPIEIPEFGITFVGTGTGFDPGSLTSCFIIWINGKGIAVDLVSNCESHFRRLGFTPNDVTHIFLSHLHADHDAGVLEAIMIGEKTRILTSDVIFDSFLRKAVASTKFTKENIKDFVNFTGLEDGKEVRIPGIKGAYITFDYSFHSIPSGRFKLRYKGQNGKEMLIGFSGDTKYDKELVNKLYKDGTITSSRRDKILGFLWDCDIIIHEVGGGVLHTNVKSLSEFPERLKKRIILTHADKKTRETKPFHFVNEGETIHLVKKKYRYSAKELLPLVKNTGLFPNLTFKQFGKFLQNSTIKTFSKTQYVFKQDDIGHKFYVILSGFAEVIKNDNVIAIYDKGCFFGELALLGKDKRRKTSVRATSKLTLLCIERSIYKKINISSIIQERMYDFVNFFTDWLPPSLIGYLSRGELLVFKKGEKIITYGDTSKEIYVLISGEIDIVDKAGKVVAHIANVEIFGEIAFLKQVPRTASAIVSTEQTTVIRINNKLFTEIFEKFPSFYGTVLKKMDRRLDISMGWIL
ncbi:MAG: cyclic nucleotide-binding domain-containing protein [Candidatus Anammoxibacter sp.]